MPSFIPMGDLPVTIVTDTCKDFRGVTVATRTVIRVQGQQQSMTVKKVERNAVKADDSALPAENKPPRHAPKSPTAPEGGTELPKEPDAPAPPAGTK